MDGPKFKPLQVSIFYRVRNWTFCWILASDLEYVFVIDCGQWKAIFSLIAKCFYLSQTVVICWLIYREQTKHQFPKHKLNVVCLMAFFCVHVCVWECVCVCERERESVLLGGLHTCLEARLHCTVYLKQVPAFPRGFWLLCWLHCDLWPLSTGMLA